MSFLNLLRAARNTAASAFHQYKLNLAPKPAILRVHAFFEGHDDESFYTQYIRQRRGDAEIRTYKCGNRDEVYATHIKVMAHPTAALNVTLFFVDKDFSDVIPEANPVHETIFITEPYSIENYLVCRSVLERLWAELARLNRVDFDAEVVFKQFEASLQSFQRDLLPVMAWIVFARRSGCNPVLADINLAHLFEFDDFIVAHQKQKLQHGALLSTLEKWTNCKTPPQAWKGILSVLRIFRTLPPKKVIRGKFEAWFFVQFFSRAIDIANTAAKETGGSVKLKTLLHLDNFVEVCASRLACPPELGMFLDRHL